MAVVDPLEEDARKRAVALLAELASEYGGRVTLSSRVRDSVVSSLSEAEIVSNEARRYSAVVVLLASPRTARLAYDIGAGAERPIILIVAGGASCLQEALDVYDALLRQRVQATRPIAYPFEKRLLDEYMEAVSTLSRLYGSSFIIVGGVPSWLATPQLPLMEVRRLFDAIILQMDLNELVERFEEIHGSVEVERLAEVLANRGVELHAPREELGRTLALTIVLEKLALDNHAAGVALNCRDVQARLGTSLYVASAILLDNDSIPVVCDTDIQGVITAALTSVLTETLIVYPSDVDGESRIRLDIAATPLSVLENPRISLDPRLGVVLQGKPRIGRDILLLRLDLPRRILHICKCRVERGTAEPLPALTASCPCVFEMPGRSYALLPRLDALRRVERVAELLGLRVELHRSTDTD